VEGGVQGQDDDAASAWATARRGIGRKRADTWATL
jgi:hypothetical protein